MINIFIWSSKNIKDIQMSHIDWIVKISKNCLYLFRRLNCSRDLQDALTYISTWPMLFHSISKTIFFVLHFGWVTFIFFVRFKIVGWLLIVLLITLSKISSTFVYWYCICFKQCSGIWCLEVPLQPTNLFLLREKWSMLNRKI